jgi:hypothetical protein
MSERGTGDAASTPRGSVSTRRSRTSTRGRTTRTERRTATVVARPTTRRWRGRRRRRADDEADEDLPEHAVTALATGMGSLRPPRRTGIFVDPEDLRDHVGHLLRTILGGYEVDAFGNFTFTHEDARVFVTVGGSPIGPTVGVFSVTNLEVELTPPLASFLLATNHTLGFGAFSYDPPNRAVWLRHTLLGTTLDGPELQSAVAAVATTAARLDDHIRDRFGGRTFQEAPGDVQRRVEPPTTPAGPAGARCHRLPVSARSPPRRRPRSRGCQPAAVSADGGELAALVGAPLPLGEAAPDPEVDLVVDRVAQALLLDRTAVADAQCRPCL